MPAEDDQKTHDEDQAEDEDAPAWVRGAGVRWFGVAMFLVLGVVAVLVLVATLLAIYDRARDDSPGSSPVPGWSWRYLDQPDSC